MGLNFQQLFFKYIMGIIIKKNNYNVKFIFLKLYLPMYVYILYVYDENRFFFIVILSD